MSAARSHPGEIPGDGGAPPGTHDARRCLSRRALLRRAAAAAPAVLLAACGRKGPLYLPPPDAEGDGASDGKRKPKG